MTADRESFIVVRHQDDVSVGIAESLTEAVEIAREGITALTDSVFDVYKVEVPRGNWTHVQMVTAQDTPFDDVPEPSRYDVDNLRAILTGSLGDWFDAELFRLIRHADLSNRERLRMVYPLHVRAYEAYMRGES